MLPLLAPANHTWRIQKAVCGGQQALPDTGCLPRTLLPPSCALLCLFLLALTTFGDREADQPAPSPHGAWAGLPASIAPSRCSGWLPPWGSLK